PNARPEVIQGRTAADGKTAIGNQDAGRRPPIMRNQVVGDDVASQRAGARILDVGGWCTGYRPALQLTGPDVRQVSVLIAEDPVIFPASAQVDGELGADFPIVLEEGALIRQPVAGD